MVNMEKIYELQARIRKNATTKKFQELIIEHFGKRDKSGVFGSVYYRGNKMEFSRVDVNVTKCVAYNIMGFERVELNPTDTELLEFLFFGGGQCTPAEFKKLCEDKMQLGYRDFSKGSPALDVVVDFWHDKIIGAPLRAWQQAQTAVAEKATTTPNVQQNVAKNVGKIL